MADLENRRGNERGVEIEMEERAVETKHKDGTTTFVDREALGGGVEDMPEGYFRSWGFVGSVGAVCCASICAYLGWVLPANTLSLINDDIGPSDNIGWVATVWTLGTAVGFLLVGRLSDIFGRKWMVMGTSTLGLIGNIVGCTATSVTALIGANLCNGLAAAGQLSFGIILGELVPNKYRGPIVTLVFLSSAPFAVFGPVIARSFILHTAAKWRWSYYLGIIMSVVSLVLFQVFYHPPTYTQLHVRGKTKLEQLKELDYGGMLLFTGGMVLFLIGLSWGGTSYPWNSPQVLCALIIGIVALVAFGFYEAFVVKHTALIPLRLFKNIGYISIVACATIAAMVYYSLTVLWPTIISTVYSTNSLTIGWQSSVVGGGTLLGQVLGGFAISYVPKVKYQTILAACLAFTFITALTSISKEHNASFIAFGVLGCVAVGFVDNITFPGVTLVIDPQDIGLASGVLGSIRAAGGAVAQALYSSILNNKEQHYQSEFVTSAATAAGFPQSQLPQLFEDIAVGNFTAMPEVTLNVELAIDAGILRAHISSFRTVFFASIPFGILLIVAACFVPNMEGFLGGNVAKKLQHLPSRKKALKEVKSEKSSLNNDQKGILVDCRVPSM